MDGCGQIFFAFAGASRFFGVPALESVAVHATIQVCADHHIMPVEGAAQMSTNLVFMAMIIVSRYYESFVPISNRHHPSAQREQTGFNSWAHYWIKFLAILAHIVCCVIQVWTKW